MAGEQRFTKKMINSSYPHNKSTLANKGSPPPPHTNPVPSLYAAMDVEGVFYQLIIHLTRLSTPAVHTDLNVRSCSVEVCRLDYGTFQNKCIICEESNGIPTDRNSFFLEKQIEASSLVSAKLESKPAVQFDLFYPTQSNFIHYF